MAEKKQKVICITVFHPQISKNILNTDVFRKLRDSGEYRLVLLVPDIKKTFYERHYSHENVVIEAFEMQPFVEGWFENFMQVFARLLIDTHYLHYKRRELLDANRSVLGWARYMFRGLVLKLFSDSAFFAFIFRKMDAAAARNDVYTTFLNTYSPDLVFSTDMFEQMGAQLIREAKKSHIKTVGMVRSWDNCLSKGLLRVIPDVTIVNNFVVRDELTTLHGVALESIHAVGLPQFDDFISEKPDTREEFFNKNGLDPKKRLVMFAPAGSILSDTDTDICSILVQARTEGHIPQDIQFFVRNHPQHPANLTKMKDVPDFIVQSPGEILDKKTHKETELTPNDIDFLRNILAHTDVLVWVATTLCLDALIYDIPEVVVNFDGYKEKEYYTSVKRYHDEDHMKKMFALKPFRIANKPQELINLINLYLKDKTIDKTERESVRAQQLLFTDGHSGERVVNVIKGFLT